MDDRCFTIDGPTSQDLDDAVSVRQEGDRILLQVHIANVAWWVPKGSQEDQLARARVTSRYRPGRVLPMLSYEQQRRASLLPGKYRQVFSVKFTLHLDTLEPDAPAALQLGEVESAARLCYTDVPAILSAAHHPHKEALFLLSRVAERLLARRRHKGALALYDLNHRWVTTEEGVIKRLDRDEATLGYVIVQELMILANAELARYAAEQEIPILYRTHAARAHAPSRAALLAQLDAASQVALPEGQLDALRETTHLALGRATYSATIGSHFGLCLPAYTHATSPLRRYADLLTQRQLAAVLYGDPVPHSRDEITEIAAHIEAHVAKEREASSAFFRARAMEPVPSGEENLVRRGHLISDRALSAALLAALAEQPAPPPALAEVLSARLSAGRLPLLDAFRLLLTSPACPAWDPLRDKVLAQMVAQPPLGPQIAAMAMAQLGWPPPIFSTTQKGPEHRPTFSASAQLCLLKPGTGTGRHLATDFIDAPSLKEAKQRALVALLFAAVGQPAPIWPEAAAPPSEAKSPVATLQEMCAVRKASPPCYVFSAEGPPHKPRFTCTVQALGQMAQGVGATKQEAKQEAAAALLGEAAYVDRWVKMGTHRPGCLCKGCVPPCAAHPSASPTARPAEGGHGLQIVCGACGAVLAAIPVTG
jgi:ribonuclease R